MFNRDLTDLRVLWLQVGVYLGKRDFVDRVDCVDPVGEDSFFIPSETVFPKITADSGKRLLLRTVMCFH